MTDIESQKRPRKIKDLNENKLMNDLLWSDPRTPRDIENLQETNEEKRNLIDRPTFTQDDANEFLKRLNLKHIVRAHQTINEGYQDKFGDKSVITVFSSANYCGISNKGAIMEYNNEDDYKFTQFNI